MLRQRLIRSIATMAMMPAGDDGAASGTSSAPTAEDIAAAQEVLRRAGDHATEAAAVPTAAPAPAAAAVPAAAASTVAAAPVADQHVLTLQAHANYLGLGELVIDDVIDVWNKFRPISDSEQLKSLAHSLLVAASLFIGK